MIFKVDASAVELLKGLASYIGSRWISSDAGGEMQSMRYAYSVWLRHFIFLSRKAKMSWPLESVLEFGPGKNIGVGVAALFSGCEHYIGLDIKRYNECLIQSELIDELKALFETKDSLPGSDEFPELKPALPDSQIPMEVLGRFVQRDKVTAVAKKIRMSLKAEESSHDARENLISFYTYTEASSKISNSSIDLIFSQAVLEHIDDIEGAYAAMYRWLKPGGLMSHQIDFRSHELSKEWNGHWTIPDWLWKKIVGRRSFLLNRQPLSIHRRIWKQLGLTVQFEQIVRSASRIERNQLATPFKEILTEDDLVSSGAYVILQKP